MKTGTFYCACHDVPKKFFGWIVCVLRTHQWEVNQRWEAIGQAEVVCYRCGQSQFLSDVPNDWDGQFTSRRFDPVIAALTGLMVLTPMVVLLVILR